ncbi:hypothetical protein [Methanospirillum hungatei]|uniref:hypothetical protein n=1 Tax=Methanospirillum hungatei TaxID=2203 RepID=UPI0026EB2D92|nr:hypothetical protein [Methanospirillum hungatei]MCA1915493.1 hypothetical protein [Methanospirillum hungatei]
MIPDIHQDCIQVIRKAGLLENIYSLRKRNLIIKDCDSISCFYVTLDDLRQVIIWDCSKDTDIDDEIKKELIIHLKNTGACAGYRIIGSTISQVINGQKRDPEFSNIIKPLPELIQTGILCESVDISESLDRYLDAIHKTLSGVFYRTYGESDRERRELLVLSGILKTVTEKILEICGIDFNTVPEDSWICHLVTCGSAIPGYLKDEPPCFPDPVTHSMMVREGCSLPVPEPIRIHLIDPVILVRAVSRLMTRVRDQNTRKKDYIASTCDISSLISSPVFFHVIRCLKESEGTHAIVDPQSGNGELLLLLLRSHAGKEDSPHDRFNRIADTVFCSEPSFSSVMLTRFGLILHAIDGNFLHPDLFQPCKKEQMDIFRSHIRVGNILFSKEITNEYLSVHEAQAAVHSLRPSDEDWLDRISRPAMLITAPCRQKAMKDPEVHQYLCKHFSSYSYDAMTALYTAEYAIRKEHQSFILLPSAWLSDMHARPFRKMIRRSRVTHIILDEHSPGQDLSDTWSCICAGIFSPSIGITRFTTNGTMVSYHLNRDDLPGEDGWNLEDPLERVILNYLLKDSVSLSEYCLGGLYTPEDLSEYNHEGSWISLKDTTDGLLITSGDTYEKAADIIIKGPDEYLESLLGSPLIRWYCRYMSKNQPSLHPEHLISAIPVHQPDWYCPEEREHVRQITKSFHERAFLIQRREYARSFHDKERIGKKLQQIEEEINFRVCSLYQIPKTLQDRLLTGEGNDSSLPEMIISS